MSLTLGEKGHWRDRIAARIDKRIETLVAKGDPTLLQRVAEEAHQKAFESLGIASQQKELETIQKQKEELERREKRLYAEQRALIHGTTVEHELEHGQSCYYGRDDRVEGAVRSRATVHEDAILGASELGSNILSLRAEKESLLDTIWLATSSAQIKELWGQVNALLEAEPTTLEEKALAIEPAQEGGA